MSYSIPEAVSACAYAAASARIAAPDEILPRLKKYGDLRPDLSVNSPNFSTSLASASLRNSVW
jgi:hypothetical protein